jgi:hypothetical protein
MIGDTLEPMEQSPMTVRIVSNQPDPEARRDSGSFMSIRYSRIEQNSNALNQSRSNHCFFSIPTPGGPSEYQALQDRTILPCLN